MKKLFSILINGYTQFKNILFFLFTGLSYSKIVKHSIIGSKVEITKYLSYVFKTGDSNNFFQFAQKYDIINDGNEILRYNRKLYDFNLTEKYGNMVFIEVKYSKDSYLSKFFSIGFSLPFYWFYKDTNNINYLLFGIILYFIILTISNIIQRIDYIILKRRFEFLEFLIISEKNNSID